MDTRQELCYAIISTAQGLGSELYVSDDGRNILWDLDAEDEPGLRLLMRAYKSELINVLQGKAV